MLEVAGGRWQVASGRWHAVTLGWVVSGGFGIAKTSDPGARSEALVTGCVAKVNIEF